MLDDKKIKKEAIEEKFKKAGIPKIASWHLLYLTGPLCPLSNQ
jgi:hypothetical protein